MKPLVTTCYKTVKTHLVNHVCGRPFWIISLFRFSSPFIDRGLASVENPRMQFSYSCWLAPTTLCACACKLSGRVRRIRCSRCRQNLHHAVARERFRSQNRKKLAGSERFWKLSVAKFAPRSGARAIWKSKPLKTSVFGRLFDVQFAKLCTTLRRESVLEVKMVKNWHVGSTLGSWASQNLHHASIWKSKSLKQQVLGTFLEVERASRVAGAGISTRCKWRGRRRSSWGLRKRWHAWWVWRGSEIMLFAWQAQWFRALWNRCLKPRTLNPWKGCKFHVTEVLLCRDHFAWQLQEFVWLGLTFSWQAQSFWSIHFKIAETYWNSEVKSLVHMQFLKDVSQKSFAFEVQSVIFEGSLAEKLPFWVSNFQTWRKSRRQASFLSFKVSFLKEVSQKRKSPIPLNLKPVSRQTIWISNQLTTKSLESQVSWQPKSFESQIKWQPKSFESQITWRPHRLNLKWIDNINHLNLTSVDSKIIWISNQLTTKSPESQINWQPKSCESQITWQPNHPYLKSLDNILNLTSLDSQLTWTSNQLQPNHLNLKSVDNQNRLNRKSNDNQIIWLSSHLNLTSIDFRTNWIPHLLPIGSLSLETSATASCGRYVKKLYSHIEWSKHDNSTIAQHHWAISFLRPCFSWRTAVLIPCCWAFLWLSAVKTVSTWADSG